MTRLWRIVVCMVFALGAGANVVAYAKPDSKTVVKTSASPKAGAKASQSKSVASRTHATLRGPVRHSKRQSTASTPLKAGEAGSHSLFSGYSDVESNREEGMGGWYGKFHHGKRTASGGIFSPQELTAAHPSYPFNSLLKVTEPQSGQSVIVRVTDRGPYVKGRIIDLSERAAKEIGIWQRGVARVVVERLNPAAAAAAAATQGDWEPATVASRPLWLDNPTPKVSQRVSDAPAQPLNPDAWAESP